MAITRPDTGEVQPLTTPLLTDQTDALRDNALRFSRRPRRVISSTIRPRIVDILTTGAATGPLSRRPARLSAIAVQLSGEA